MHIKRFETIHKYNSPGKITYIMSDAFRLHYNHGLQKALELSNNNLQVILFKQREENNRNNDFFFQGINSYKGFLKKYTTDVHYFEELSDSFVNLIKESSIIIKDRAYLKEDLLVEQEIIEITKDSSTTLILVESNVFVPVTYASNKEEYGARTIRPKILSKLNEFDDLNFQLGPSFFFEQKARDLLNHFIEVKLKNYDQSNDPSLMYTSQLSPYLKYGFISPLEIYHALEPIQNINKEAFLEQLIVRRELSYNFVYYNKDYNDFYKITYPWAYLTMEIHQNDHRQYIYTKQDYINFKTHDPYFNTAMKEMVILGTMHNYMRMYWAKKIIEWSPNYKVAYETIITLNNYYFLDGNTPNGYTGVAWCFGKHDRAWTERQIFGKIRYMNMNGLKRKFDIDQYVINIDRIIGE